MSEDVAQRSVVIFLSYRRGDTQWAARGIYDRLVNKYGRTNVFRDLDTIPPGVRFRDYVEEKISESDVFILLIGRAWTSYEDEAGRRRLEQARDPVRLEIEAALRLAVPIIPVRVEGAPMPTESDLVPSIVDLLEFNAAELSDSRWDYDVDKLLWAINKTAERKQAHREAEERARRVAEERARREAEEQARQEAEEQARRDAEEQARRLAEERARREAEEEARREAEEEARRDAEERARRVAEERARREAEEQARRDAEERARREAEEEARREAEEQARREAEEQARRDAEEQARRLAEERARREAEEEARREAEEQARREAEEQARRDAEEQARRLAEERARREAEEEARREAEEQARREAEERARRAEEQARRDAEEQARRDAEEQARRKKDEAERQVHPRQKVGQGPPLATRLPPVKAAEHIRTRPSGAARNLLRQRAAILATTVGVGGIVVMVAFLMAAQPATIMSHLPNDVRGSCTATADKSTTCTLTDGTVVFFRLFDAVAEADADVINGQAIQSDGNPCPPSPPSVNATIVCRYAVGSEKGLAMFSYTAKGPQRYYLVRWVADAEPLLRGEMSTENATPLDWATLEANWTQLAGTP